jgi:hypothetical protein
MSEQIIYDTVVMFADVVGSSKLYKQEGNDEANRQISDVVNRLMDQTRQHNGVVIKTLGDEVMAHFKNPNDAFRASIAMQQIGEETLPISVGMAWGNVIEKDADLFGQAVNDAAAVVKISRGKQVITTQQHKDALTSENAAKLSVFDEVKLKGGKISTTLFRIDWESQYPGQGYDHTIIKTNTSAVQDQLIVSYIKPDGTKGSIALTESNAPLHIGRDETNCQVTLSTNLASRDHCHINYQYGKFVLVDHSTNGTYVTNADSQEVYLRREELPLLGSGCIGLGEKTDAANQFAIKFCSLKLS